MEKVENYINKIPTKIRWVIALPISLICGVIVRWIALTGYYLWVGIDTNDWWPFVLGAIAETSAFIYVFYLLVPSNKFLASIIASSAWGGFTLCVLIMLLINQSPFSAKIFDILTDLTTIIVLIIANISIYNETKESNGEKGVMDA